MNWKSSEGCGCLHPNAERCFEKACEREDFFGRPMGSWAEAGGAKRCPCVCHGSGNRSGVATIVLMKGDHRSIEFRFEGAGGEQVAGPELELMRRLRRWHGGLDARFREELYLLGQHLRLRGWHVEVENMQLLEAPKGSVRKPKIEVLPKAPETVRARKNKARKKKSKSKGARAKTKVMGRKAREETGHMVIDVDWETKK